MTISSTKQTQTSRVADTILDDMPRVRAGFTGPATLGDLDTHIAPDPTALLDAARHLLPYIPAKSWLNWGLKITNPETGKGRKLPLFGATSTNHKWTDLRTAAAKIGKRDDWREIEATGVGFIIGGTRGITIDIDDCRDAATGELNGHAQSLLQECGSFGHVTTSKTGIRIIGLNRSAEPIPGGKYNAVFPDGQTVELYVAPAPFFNTFNPDIIDGYDLPLVDISGVVQRLLDTLERGAGGKRDRSASPGQMKPGFGEEWIGAIRATMALIPNGLDIDWRKWSEVGAAIYHASGGSLEGLQLYRDWTARHPHPEVDVGDCDERWDDWRDSPYTAMTFGTLIYMARQFDPTFVPPNRPAEEAFEAIVPAQSVDDAARDLAISIERSKLAAAMGGLVGAKLMTDFNRKFAMVWNGAKTVIYKASKSEVTGGFVYEEMPIKDFATLYTEGFIVVEVNGAPQKVRDVDWWLTNRHRNRYTGGVVFDPSEKQDGDQLNLWRGWGVKPVQGDWSLLRAHIKDNICQDQEDAFVYLMGWMAYMVQFPARMGEVAPVLKGPQGTGKGILGRALLKLTGDHGATVRDPKHLVGAFNEHLRANIFIFADEAFFAGDKAQVGSLKAIVTENSIMMEGKHKKAKPIPNRQHVLMASNNDWVVPADAEERRFFVLDVGTARMQDKAYFGAISEQMESGGYEAMLFDLMHYDLSDFDVRTFPVTTALIGQKLLSMKTHDSWIYESLHQGYFFSGLGWQEWLSTEQLYQSYRNFADQQNERFPYTKSKLGAVLKASGFSPYKPSKDPRTGEAFEGSRPPGYALHALEDARRIYAGLKMLGDVWTEIAVAEADEAIQAKVDASFQAQMSMPS